jgi:hypothetical protein
MDTPLFRAKFRKNAALLSEIARHFIGVPTETPGSDCCILNRKTTENLVLLFILKIFINNICIYLAHKKRSHLKTLKITGITQLFARVRNPSLIVCGFSSADGSFFYLQVFSDLFEQCEKTPSIRHYTGVSAIF